MRDIGKLILEGRFFALRTLPMNGWLFRFASPMRKDKKTEPITLEKSGPEH